MQNKSQGWWVCASNPNAEKQTGRPWSLLASQPSQLGKFRTVRSLVSRNQVAPGEWHLRLFADFHNHINTHTCNCTFIHTHMYLQIHKHTGMCTFTHIHVPIDTQACAPSYTFVCLHTHACAPSHTYITTHTQRHVHLHTHTCTCITHKHTHTHIHNSYCGNFYVVELFTQFLKNE